MLDLSSAVQNALIEHDQDELPDNEPSTSQAHLDSVDPDEDELTRPSETPCESPITRLSKCIPLTVSSKY